MNNEFNKAARMQERTTMNKTNHDEKNNQERRKQVWEKQAKIHEEQRQLAEKIKRDNHLNASADEIMTAIKAYESIKRQKRLEEKQKERAERLVENAKKEEKKTKRVKIAKKVVAAAIAAVVAAGVACRFGLPSYFDGKRQIEEQFYKVTSSYSVLDSSEGYILIHGGKYSLNDDEFYKMVHEMVNRSLSSGMTEEEAYIGLSSKVSKVAAENEFGYTMDTPTNLNTCIQKANEKTI